MSDVRYYRDLLTNQRRVSAFRDAIRATVRPGDRVLDVGTGLGTYAFFAADAGAARVYAVDGDPIVHVARTIGRLARYEDRVHFIRGRLPDVTPPERVDVIVFEDFPARFVDPAVARLLTDVWTQWAKPDCRIVPRGATLYAAPVRSPALWRRALSFADTEIHHGIDWLPSREYAANTPLAVWMDGGDLAAAPAALASVPVARPLDGAALVGRACDVPCEGGLHRGC